MFWIFFFFEPITTTEYIRPWMIHYIFLEADIYWRSRTAQQNVFNTEIRAINSEKSMQKISSIFWCWIVTLLLRIVLLWLRKTYNFKSDGKIYTNTNRRYVIKNTKFYYRLRISNTNRFKKKIIISHEYNRRISRII